MRVLEFILQKNPSLDSSYSWFIAICGCFYMVLNNSYFMISGIIFVLIQERYQVTKQMASYPMNTFTSVSFILSIVSGPIHHRLKTRKTLILGAVIGMLGSCMSVFSPTDDPIAWLSVCMAVRGFGSSLGVAPIYQVIATHFQKHQAKAFMVLAAAFSLAGLILPSIVVASAEAYGLESSWLIQAALYCQSLILALVVRPRRQEPIAEQELKSILEGDRSKLPEKATQKGESLKTVLFELFRDKNFYVMGACHNITISTMIVFRMTIVDYGIDINLEPNLNKYILEVLSFVDLARIPAAFLLDSKVFYVETLLGLAHGFMALAIFLLTLTGNVTFVVVACVYATFYAVGATSLAPGFATLGTSRIAVTIGIFAGTMGLFLLFLPFLIGLFRDTYGSYDYLFYIFAIVNSFAAILFAWTRKNGWFKHNK